MTHTDYQKLSAPLRISVIALWILSLISVGVSPLYYVSTSVSSVAEDTVSRNTTSPTDAPDDSHSAYSLRLTHNPFLVEAAGSKCKADEPSPQDCCPLDSDGGLTRHAPVGTPVVLWLVSAGASGTVSSSNLTRLYPQSDSAETQPRRPAVGALTATAIHAEHPAKRSAATLLGQKPSGVS